MVNSEREENRFTVVQEFRLNDDLSSDTFKEVKKWKVNVGNTQEIIGSSRLIHVIYDTIYDNPMGISKIEPEFDSHVYRQVIVESAISTFYQNSFAIKIFETPEDCSRAEKEWLEENVEQLKEKAEIVVPHGTEVDMPAPEISDPSNLLEHLMETNTSMPYPLLTGVNAGAVTGSETNLRIYYIEIQKKRRRTINDMIVDKLNYLQGKGALPEGEFELEWGDVFDLSAEEDAAVGYKKAMTVDKLVSAGVLDEEEAREWF